MYSIHGNPDGMIGGKGRVPRLNKCSKCSCVCRETKSVAAVSISWSGPSREIFTTYDSVAREKTCGGV